MLILVPWKSYFVTYFSSFLFCFCETTDDQELPDMRKGFSFLTCSNLTSRDDTTKIQAWSLKKKPWRDVAPDLIFLTAQLPSLNIPESPH